MWLGWSNAAPPTPTDLARTEQIDGYVVTLEDPSSIDNSALRSAAFRYAEQSRQSAIGNCQWLVPIGRIFPEGTALPAALALGPGRKIVRTVLPRFAEACRTAGRIWDQVRAAVGLLNEGEKVAPMSDLEEFEAAAAILGLNYRVGAAELSALGCLTTKNLQTVLTCFVDLPGYVRHARGPDSKKNLTGGSGPPA
jgi:hypothetical protein